MSRAGKCGSRIADCGFFSGLLIAVALAIVIPLVSLPAREATQATPATPGVGAVQYLAYFAGTRPMLVKLHVEVDGRPFDAAWDEYIEALFKFLDRDGDGTLSAAEAARAPTAQELLQILRGNLFAPFNGADKDMRTFEADDEGKVSLEGFTNYYLKNGAGPVQVTNYPVQTAAAEALTDALFELLDTNADGKLSKEELGGAERKLLKLDANEDDLVSTLELVPTLAVQYGPADENQVQTVPGQQSKAPESRFFALVPDGSPRYLNPRMELARKILERYDKDGDGKLSRNEVGMLGEFDLLDRNKNGFLDQTALMRYIGLDGDVELILRIGRNEADKPLAESFRPHGKPARLTRPITTSAQGNAKFVDEGTEIDVRAVDGILTNPSQVRQAFLDTFRALDKERTGFVTLKQAEDPQFAMLRDVFALADRNADGKLSEQELRDYLDLQSKAANAFIRLSIADNGSGLFGVLDANHDGQLGIRELRSAALRLKQYDENLDGCISRKELPHQLHVLVSRGEPRVNGPLLGASSAPSVGPLWFRLMDRNGDGDVSPREFLGTAEEFQRFDRDGDGLISLEEAVKADASFRKR
jgi:Ca2+-binding EF-hand superfamily protein